MIESFAASWPLFHNSWLAGWSIALLLGLLGVWVVARDQIFLGAAVAQASTFGVAVTLWLAGLASGAWAERLESHTAHSVAALAFALVATALTSRGARAGDSREAVTGWVFLTASAGATLLLARSPHGLEEIQQLLTSSLIGATRADVAAFGMLALVGASLTIAKRRALLLFATDPEMASAVGLRTGVYRLGVSGALGLAVGLGIHVAGTVYTFGCLVLPALIARGLAPSLASMLWLAPAIALAASALGFVLANHYDLPPAQVTVGLLSLGWAVRALVRRR